MNKKLKQKIFIYMIAIFIIISLITSFILFHNKNFIRKYTKEDITFEYLSNFKIKEKDNAFIITSKDKKAIINIDISTQESVYSNSEYHNIANDIFEKVGKDSNLLASNCIDHMCINIFETKKEKTKIVVEFRDNVMITYKYNTKQSEFDKYIKGFDTIVNSFYFKLDRTQEQTKTPNN